MGFAGPERPPICGAAGTGGLRRAAALQDHLKFAALLREGAWTADKVVACVDSSGKSPLHLAAWRGSIDNVRLLLAMGVDMEAFSDGPHNYGKSAIFYAITRCRDDVVHLLLDHGASVKIVNNKGQTPLSLAASHLEDGTIAAISAREIEIGDTQPWRNYYFTHWDGVRYGDLDPRFLPEERGEPGDVVADLVINPTTREGRRGDNFNRLTGDRYGGARGGYMSPPARRPNGASSDAAARPLGAPPEKPSSPSEEEVEAAWAAMAVALGGDVLRSTLKTNAVADALLHVLHRRYVKSSWLPVAILRLRTMLRETAATPIVEEAVLATNEKSAVCDRDGSNAVAQANKLRLRFFRGALANGSAPSSDAQRSKSSTACTGLTDMCTSIGGVVCAAPAMPRGGPANVLELHPAHHRCTWVGTVVGLREVRSILAQKEARHVGFDTEWRNAEDGALDLSSDGEPCLALLQLAIEDTDDEAADATTTGVEAYSLPGASCWLIDICAADADASFQSELAALSMWLMSASSGITLVGFALDGDLTKLNRLSSVGTATIPAVLDLQVAALRGGCGSSGQLPSLRAVVERWMPGRTLDKAEQCSDWARRPLTPPQVPRICLLVCLCLSVLCPILSARALLGLLQRPFSKFTIFSKVALLKWA